MRSCVFYGERQNHWTWLWKQFFPIHEEQLYLHTQLPVLSSVVFHSLPLRHVVRWISDGCRPEMAASQTRADGESGERQRERLQNGVMNAREEWRLWHGWLMWEMREWFDSGVQGVPIRWIYFPRMDSRRRRHLITHPLHPLVLKAQRDGIASSVVYLELSRNRPLETVCTLWACMLHVSLCVHPGPDVVAKQLLNQVIREGSH